MKSKQELFRAFCIHEPLYPLSVKIIIYAFNFSLNLCFNALLFTEEQIYEGIKSLGKNVGNIFLRAFYSFLIIKVIDYFVHLIYYICTIGGKHDSDNNIRFQTES